MNTKLNLKSLLIWTMSALCLGRIALPCFAANPAIQPDDPAIDKKVDALLAKMTIEEKVYQLCAVFFGSGNEVLQSGGEVSEKLAAVQLGEHGVGSLSVPTVKFEVQKGVAAANMLQRYAIEKTRLGIPMLINNEALHGLMLPGACSYPQAIGLASTFNPALVEQIGVAIGEEARSRGTQQIFDPVLDLGRDPRHGRVEETYGEDPYLASRMGVAYVRGVQSQGVVCTLKHFVANFVGAGGREGANINFSERTLRETYFVPYAAAIREAGALGVMCAYNAVDGTPCAINHWLLTDVLRGEWGFQGIVVSDWSAVNHVLDQHHAAATKAEAARLCITAGLDVDLPRVKCYKELITEVQAGRVSPEIVNESVRRVLRLKFRLGLFDHPYCDPDEAERLADAPAHRQLAREAACQSMVLLKNDHAVLPIRPEVKTIAVIGPNAARLQLGGYSAGQVKGVTPLAALTNRLGGHVAITYAAGCGLVDNQTTGFAAALAAAKNADLCVMFMGGSNPLTGGETRERATLELLGQQEQLIGQIAALGKPVVVVLIDGRPIVMNHWIDKVAAVVMAWYPGEEGGDALADILTGACNPSGHLPITFPLLTGQCPMTYDAQPYGREGSYVELEPQKDQPRYAPRFAFGFGLSYTTFKFSNLKFSPEKISSGGQVTVRVDVANTGSRAGVDVVQLYLAREICRITQPVERLRRFSRIALAPGESKTVAFTLDARDTAFLNEQLKPEVDPGKFSIRVGDNCLDGVTGEFQVTGEPTRASTN